MRISKKNIRSQRVEILLGCRFFGHGVSCAVMAAGIILSAAAYAIEEAEEDQSEVFLTELSAVLPPEADLPAGVFPDDASVSTGIRKQATDLGELLAAAQEMGGYGRFRESENLYLRALNLPGSEMEKRDVVLGLAKLYEQHASPARAAGKYQTFLRLYPNDRERSEVQFRLGHIYRDMGLDDQALGWFYSVLSSVIALEREQIPGYRALTRKAQFEIAKTWFYRRDYERARTFFSRINLLDLGEEDRESVQFYLIKSVAYGGGYQSAVRDLKAFVESYPDSPMLPEAMFLMADSLSATGRLGEAEEVLVSLLEKGSSGRGIHNETWDYWRRRAGNHFANRFYEEGNVFAALRIYQSIAELSDEAGWRWNIIYQIGLCLERLRQDERAREAYAYIIEQGAELKTNGALSRELENLLEMTRWRIEVLGWTGDVKARFQKIISLDPTEQIQ